MEVCAGTSGSETAAHVLSPPSVTPTCSFTHTPPHPLPSSAADRVDVLKILDLSDDMEGVSLEAGLCVSREGQEETDLSFKIDKKIQLSAPTKQLFPSKTEQRRTRLQSAGQVCAGDRLCDSVLFSAAFALRCSSRFVLPNKFLSDDNSSGDEGFSGLPPFPV